MIMELKVYHRLKNYFLGVLQYYIHHNKEFLSYAPLKKELCQVLRELGNILTFCMQFELALAQEEMLDLLCAAAFTNVIPKPPAESLEEQEEKMKNLEKKYSRIQIANIVQHFGNENQAKIAKESELLTKERLCCGLNIFEMVLTRLRDTLLADQIWRGNAPANGVMWVDECVEFHRLWSGIQFVLCLHLMGEQTSDAVPNGLTMSIEEIFGDGIYWAGCTLIRLLGQYRRFEVFDYAYHLLRVYRAEPRTNANSVVKEIKEANQKTAPLVDRIRRIQAGNNLIFSILGNYMQQMEEQDEEVNVRHFPPPVYQPNQYNRGTYINNGGSSVSSSNGQQY